MQKRCLPAVLLALLLAGCAGSGAAPAASSPPPSAEGRQVLMTAGDVEVVITLNGSRAAADFARMLPLELNLIERNGFAKGMTLPRALDTSEETTRSYQVGDFGYWAAGPDLAIFYDDTYEQTVVPVIPMGHAESGAEQMRDAAGTVTLELLPETQQTPEESEETP
ncbi:MAG TPA: hypothetical protein H9915_10240 [Candidatus Gemmiger faecigallinarum]|nr:hypothetical protein [Candidatus Gemmiger faecigallinarum]